jgi:hypothetical protein
MDNKYIHEIETISCSNGELCLSYDDTTLIFNTDSLYKDLYIIIDLVVKENSKSQKRYSEQLKETLKQAKKVWKQ